MPTDKKKSNNLDDIIPAHWMNAFDANSDSKSNLSPSERVKIVEKAYRDILGREPDTRDLNYYKYSSATEDTIRQELIEGKEHKALIENGREFKKLKNLFEGTKAKIKSLEAEIRDQQASAEQMNQLLKEKNLHIDELRMKEKHPFESN